MHDAGQLGNLPHHLDIRFSHDKVRRPRAVLTADTPTAPKYIKHAESMNKLAIPAAPASQSTLMPRVRAVPLEPSCKPAKVTQNQKSGRLRPSPWLRAHRSICSGCTAPGEGVGEPWQPRRTPRARLCGARARRKEELQQPLPSSLASLKNLKPWSLRSVGRYSV